MSEFKIFKDREGRLLLPYEKTAPSVEFLRENGYVAAEYFTSEDKKQFVVLKPLLSQEERLVALEGNELSKTESVEVLKTDYAKAKTVDEKLAVLAKVLGLI